MACGSEATELNAERKGRELPGPAPAPLPGPRHQGSRERRPRRPTCTLDTGGPPPRDTEAPSLLRESQKGPRTPARLCYLRPGRERRRAHVCRPPSEPGSPSLCAEEEGTEWLQPRTVKTRSAKGRPLPPPTLKPHESKTSGHLPWEGDSSLQRAPSAQQVDP